MDLQARFAQEDKSYSVSLLTPDHMPRPRAFLGGASSPPGSLPDNPRLDGTSLPNPVQTSIIALLSGIKNVSPIHHQVKAKGLMPEIGPRESLSLSGNISNIVLKLRYIKAQTGN